MKTKLFTLLLAVIVSAGTMFASVTIDGIAYNLNETELTAEVTKGGSYFGDVVIPESVIYNSVTYTVTSIRGLAFGGCTGLTSIEIPKSVTRIDDCAFYNCIGLTSIVWNAKNCSDYTFTYEYSPFHCRNSQIYEFDIRSQITSFIFGDEVEHIPAYLCAGMSQLSNMTIPNSVTSIGDYAFSGCFGLTSIEIPNSVASIGGTVFFGTNVREIHFTGNINEWCTKAWNPSQISNSYDLYINGNMLTSIEIPNSVTSIGVGVFSGCTGLTSVTIGNSVTNISAYAFQYCNRLTSVTIGNSVTSIGDKAFYGCTGLTSIEIPNSVTSIGSCAFQGCTNLTSIKIPNSVTSIGAWVFRGCGSLTSVTIPNSVTSMGDYAFHGCSNLTSVTIGNSVTSIGEGAFGLCTSLTSIVIPNSVTSIGDYAFSGCTGLTSVTIPNSVTSIGSEAFQGCEGFTSVTISCNVTNYNWRITGSTSLEHVAAPTWFFDVQESDWANCPKYLQTITVNAGELNDNILGVIARSYKTLTSLDLSGVTNTEVADETVKGFYNMTELKLPSNTEYIGYMAVADCKSLQEITIPASVKEIDNSAFENCRSLKSITFGGQAAEMPGRSNVRAASTSQLQRIGNWAFYNCHELQNLTIPEGVTEIGDGAFYGCTYLEDLSLPSSVQAVGDNTFALCAKMKKIVVNAATPPSIQAKTFFDVKRQIPVYVPDECVDAYKNDALWSEFNIMGISHMPQSIDQITNDQSPITNKVIKDGQILILRGDKTYTLQGQEVK